MKVKVISLPYIFQVLYVLCFTRPRYQMSVYRTICPLVVLLTVRRLHFSCGSLCCLFWCPLLYRFYVCLSEHNHNSPIQMSKFDIRSQFEYQKSIPNVKVRYRAPVGMSKFDIRSQSKCQIRFRMSKYHIRPKFECQNSITQTCPCNILQYIMAVDMVIFG